MAENNVQNTVLQVDTGNAIKSVKEYKAYLEELKVILLGLEKGSAEYNAVLKLLHQEQDKLNEVVADSKRGADAAEGSYKQLSQTMSDLKKEWKATGDEARRAELGTQIKEINDQLKDMDASVGDFHRNVGNYAASFEEAFNNVLGGLGQVDGAVGNLAKSTKSMIPLIKKTTQVATAGLTGIKKAIAATGIGALIIAVGFLISNFDALRKTVGISEEKFNEFKEKVLNVFEKVLAGIFGVGNALIQMLLMPIKNIIDAFATMGEVVGNIFKGQFKEAVAAAKNGIKEISDNITKGLSFKANFEEGNDFGRRLIQNIKEGAEEEKKKTTIDVDVTGSTKTKTKGKVTGNGLKEVDLSKLDSYGNPQLKARIEEEKRLAKEEAELQKVIAEQDKEFYDQLNEQLDAANQEYIQSIIDANAEEQRLLKERHQAYFDIAGAISSILGTIGDAWMDQVQAQVDAGEMSEEEGKRQFQKIKGLQIAEAIINTIAGAVGAFMGITKDTGGWGIAAAAAQAAAVTAAGVAQIKKIQSTTIGSSGSLSSSIPGVNKAASETAPNYVQVATNASDIDALRNAFKETPIYVKVTDIDSAQQGNQVRVAETSF